MFDIPSALASTKRLAFVAFVQNLREPTFRQEQRLDESRKLSRRCLPHQRRP